MSVKYMHVSSKYFPISRKQVLKYILKFWQNGELYAQQTILRPKEVSVYG